MDSQIILQSRNFPGIAAIMMNFSKPLVTPEELQCLLGWPLPEDQEQATDRQDMQSLPLYPLPPSLPASAGFARAA
jgi:hypothetical protein